jgi:hypothetical protein
MNHWQAMSLGLKQLPRALSGFEIEARFFTFTASELALIEAQRRALVRTLRRELRQTADRRRLLAYARQWLYDRKLLVMREKDLRAIISAALRQFKAKLGRTIQADAGTTVLEQPASRTMRIARAVRPIPCQCFKERTSSRHKLRR